MRYLALSQVGFLSPGFPQLWEVNRSGLLLPDISAYKFSIIIYRLGFFWHQARYSTVNSIDKMGLSTGAILRFSAGC